MQAQQKSNEDQPSQLILELDVRDRDVIAELRRHPEVHERNEYALSALRVGVLALKQAAGELDANAIRNAAQGMLSDLGQALAQGTAQVTNEVQSALRQYFDPATGALPLRIEALLRNEGELDRALRTHLAPENSTIAKALSAHLGEGSQFLQFLSPTAANGIKAQVERVLGDAIERQREQILGEFSLDNKGSALSRLVAELASHNSDLKMDLQAKVEGLAHEFSLDAPDSALSRLVARVEQAHKAISAEFSADNEQSVMTRLSRMLRETNSQIDKNLTLDDDCSALSRLRREILSNIEALGKNSQTFHDEVRTTLSTLQARKEEAARSTRHGLAFEDEVGRVIAFEAQRLNDPYESTGTTTGAMKNCKAGDFVTTLGPDSAAPGASIVWEAKEDKTYTLKRALSEIEIGRKNRQAQIGIFVFSSQTAPQDLQPFARYGNNIVIKWDVENTDSDLNLRVAYSVARALTIRENHESIESGHALNAIDLATRAIEKQIDHLDQIKVWAETVRNNGEKVVERAARMRADLAREVEALDRQVNGLKVVGLRAA